ncbi:uncharacterized [Tachysurus ichikawai]
MLSGFHAICVTVCTREAKHRTLLSDLQPKAAIKAWITRAVMQRKTPKNPKKREKIKAGSIQPKLGMGLTWDLLRRYANANAAWRIGRIGRLGCA